MKRAETSARRARRRASSQAGSITGLLTDVDTGAPAGGAPVFLTGININQNELDDSNSDPATGIYQFGPLPLGTYQVHAGGPGVPVLLDEANSGGEADISVSLSVAVTAITASGPVEISWAAVPGQVYVIEYTDNLLPDPADWNELATVMATGVVEAYVDAGATVGSRMYRVQPVY